MEVVEDGQKEFRIVARGYEKFFNTGEVPYTDVSNVLQALRRLVVDESSLVLVSSSSSNSGIPSPNSPSLLTTSPSSPTDASFSSLLSRKTSSWSRASTLWERASLVLKEQKG